MHSEGRRGATPARPLPLGGRFVEKVVSDAKRTSLRLRLSSTQLESES